MERRVLLSVSAEVLAGPVTIAGNSWTYTESTQSGSGSETLTSKGATTYAGQAAIEIDIVYANASGGTVATGQNIYGFLPQGYVLFDSKTTSLGGAVDDDVWSAPYHLIIPESLSANVPVTTPAATDTDTVTTANGVVTIGHGTKTDLITLTSETPSVSVPVDAGTFTCYQVNSTETTTSEDGTPTTDVTQTFTSPTQGLVEFDDVTNGTSIKLTKFTGTSYHLAVTTPGNALVDDKIAPVQVSLVDSASNVDTNAADAVTITASIGAASTGAGTLSGNTPVTTVNGVATFSGLSINKPGQYSLTFTDSSGRAVSTPSFDISAGKLIFKRRVSNGVAGSALEPAVDVELVDSKNKLITDAPSLVTLSISGTNAANPITGNAAELVGGVALLPALKLGAPGDYTLNASDAQGDTSVLSNSFEITGIHLAFRKEPAEAGVNAPLKYRIVLEDSRNRLVNRSSIGLGLTLNTVEGGTNAALTNTADIFNFGTADNAGPNSAAVTSPGTYTITFTVISEASNGFDYTIDPITSAAFKIAANHLAFVEQPRTTGIGIPLIYKVEMRNYRNQLVSNSTDQLTFTLVTTSSDAGAALASNVDTFVGGIAENSNRMISIDMPGTYKLSVVDVPPSPGEPVAEAVTSGFFKIKAPK